MNLYIRYFDKETFVSSVDQAIDFLSQIPEIGMNPDLEADIVIMLQVMYAILKDIKYAQEFILLSLRQLLHVCRILRIRRLCVLCLLSVMIILQVL